MKSEQRDNVMAAPSEKFAESLKALRVLQDKGVIATEVDCAVCGVQPDRLASLVTSRRRLRRSAS